MAKGYFIHMNDPTSCGGRVISGSSRKTNGVPVARMMDLVTCGKHGGTWRIIGGIEGVKDQNGQPVAGSMDSVSSCPCSARFIPQITVHQYEAVQRQRGAVTSARAAAVSSPSPSPSVAPTPPPVFAKSCLREAGCNDAGTVEEPQENFAAMSFYQSQPASTSPASASSSTPATDSETVQHAQTSKKKKPAGEKSGTAAPEKKRSLFDKVTGFFFGEAEAMPLPVVMGGGAEAGMAASASGATAKLNQDAAQALTHRMKLLSGPEVWQGKMAMNLPFVVMGAVIQSMLKGERNDLLTEDKLLEVAGRNGTVPTRVRYCWENDPDTGRLKPVGYHTGPESGRGCWRRIVMADTGSGKTVSCISR